MKNLDAARLNPCIKEQEQSYKCLDQHNYNREKCEVFFDNYNICKKFWAKVYSERRAKGIEPYLPGVEEREQIKADYKKARDAML